MSFDFDKALEELDRIDEEKVELNTRALELIRAKNAAFIELDINGFKLKVKPEIPRKILSMKRIIKKESVKEEQDDYDYDKVEKLIAIGIAALCVEEPFDDPKTWVIIGRKTDDFFGIFDSIITLIENARKDLQSFRGKPGRSGSP